MAAALAIKTAETAISGASLLSNFIEQCSDGPPARSATIYLTNQSKSHILINPQVYTYSGHCHNPPQPTVKAGITEICSFGKTAGTAYGAVGVMTYDISTEQKRTLGRLAIMFSVPHDYNAHQNWFALGIFSSEQECDECLYNLMYYNKFHKERGIGR